MSESTEAVAEIVDAVGAQGALENIGQEVLGWLQATGDLVAEQAPKLADEVVTRGMLTNGMDAAWALLIAVAGLFAFKYGIRALKFAEHTVKEKAEAYQNDEEVSAYFLGYVGTVGGGLAALVGTCVAFSNFQDLLQIYLAPRLYVLERLADLVK